MKTNTIVVIVTMIIVIGSIGVFAVVSNNTNSVQKISEVPEIQNTKEEHNEVELENEWQDIEPEITTVPKETVKQTNSQLQPYSAERCEIGRQILLSLMESIQNYEDEILDEQNDESSDVERIHSLERKKVNLQSQFANKDHSLAIRGCEFR